MSTILKETEAIAGVPEAAGTRPAPTSAGTGADSGAKPQPVALEVSVTVNGARTVEGSEKREPFSESTKTVLVFGNGAVIRLQASVAPGQLLFLTNEKTKKEVVCQVVKSKNYRNISGYVELEFTESVVGFWGMRFPGDRVAAQTGTPNVVQATPATGSPVAPQIAAVPTPLAPAVPAAAPAVPPVNIAAPATPGVVEKPATIPAPAKPAPSLAAPTTVEPSKPATNASGVPVAPVVPLVVKTEFTVSSSAAKTVLPLTGTLSLPRAAETKPAPPAAPKAPASVAPVAAAHPSATNAEPAKASADFSAESLRAENARLQEQLAALLNPPKNNAAPAAPVPVAPVSSTRAAANTKPVADATAKVLEISKGTSAQPEKTATTPAKPDSWLPDLAAVLAQDTAKTKDAAAPAAVTPIAPVTPNAPKPLAPAEISTASLQSLLEREQVKIPSWLEPLARNAAPTTSTVDEVSGGSSAATVGSSHGDTEINDGLDDVFEHGSDDLSETLPKTHEEASADEHRGEEYAENLPVPTFGAKLGIDEGSSSEGGGKGKLLAVAAVILAAVAGGGYWYTQHGGTFTTGNAQSASTAKAPTQAPAQSTAVPETNQPETRTSPVAAAAVSPSGVVKNQAPTPAPVNANLVVEKTRAAQPGNASPAAGAVNPVQVVTPPKHASLGDVHLAAPNVTRKNDGGAVSDADVSLGNSEATEGAPAVNSLVSTSGPAAPAAPVQIGGAVTSAKLLKSIPPIYPSFAKTQRVSGDVKIDALIDPTGHVTTMKVVSGPTILHQAAMDALRQWKYQPATLDGKPVPMHLTVTIQFRMQ